MHYPGNYALTFTASLSVALAITLAMQIGTIAFGLVRVAGGKNDRRMSLEKHVKYQTGYAQYAKSKLSQ